MLQRAMTGRPREAVAMQAPSDQEVVAGILNHHEEAWRELWRRHEATVNRRIRRVIGNCSRVYRSSDLFSDIKAEFHLALLDSDMRRLRSFDPRRGKLGAWLSMIAHQTAVTYVTRIVRRGAPLPMDTLADDDAGCGDGDERPSDGQRGARWIARGL